MTEWRTLRLREAEERLAGSLRRLSEDRQEVDRQVSKLNREFTPPDARQQRELEEHYRSGAAGRELQELQRRVDRGETTWEDIKSGRTDPERVRAYYRSQGKLRTLMRAAWEGQDLNEFLDEPHDAGHFFAANQKATRLSSEVAEAVSLAAAVWTSVGVPLDAPPDTVSVTVVVCVADVPRAVTVTG